jgi:hypothetical protein
MTGRTPEQRDEAIDRLMTVTAETSNNITRLEGVVSQIATVVEQLATGTDRRLKQHDLELDDHDVRVERLERDHLEHSDRMAKLEEIQTDIRAILQSVTARLTGEPPASN